MNKFGKYSLMTSLAVLLTLSTNAFVKPKITNADSLGDQSVMALDWYQTSAESKALYLQAYNVAKNNLNQDLQNPANKPTAIILDIDETVLDNSPYEAYAALHGACFPKFWNKWINSAQAKPVPGVKDFLNYANSKGVQIYYISNRSTNQLKATQKDLQNHGLPQATKSHILLKTKSEKDKVSRRKQVEQNNNVVMFFGDSLTDFNNPSKPTISSRYSDVEQNANKFGEQYIVLPNPMYGGWESAIYGKDNNRNDKGTLRKDHITVFNPSTDKVKVKTVTEK